MDLPQALGHPLFGRSDRQMPVPKPNPIWFCCAIRDRLLPPDLAHAKSSRMDRKGHTPLTPPVGKTVLLVGRMACGEEI
jgi:hypothetical protein